MPKTAWAKKLYNAYNIIKKDDKVYTHDGKFLGKATGCFTSCTATSLGSVQVGSKNNKWVSGDVEKKGRKRY